MRSLMRVAPLGFVVALACSSAPVAPATTVKIACTPSPLTPLGQDFFTDISASSGIQKNNFVPNPTTPIPINDHSRLAFVDLDGDGFDDVVTHSLFPNPQKGIPFEHLVFRNNHDKTFADFSDESGLRGVQAAFFTFGDVDNDGDQDCFAGLDIDLPGQTSSLWLNDGKGHFTKKDASGVETAALSANGVFADFDGDAFLDLYSGNGGTVNGVRDQLFLGHGDGTFTEASQNLANRSAQPTNGVVACDYDDDGDQDLFVSNYGVSIGLGWNVLWENDGTGHFTNVAKDRGFNALATGNYDLASTGNGRDAQPGDPSTDVGSNGFGIDCQDIDGDGHMDIWLATISHPVDGDFSRQWSDPSQLLLNQGAGAGFAFKNVFLDRGLIFNEGDIDAAAVDFDNDGRFDLSVTRDKKYEPNYTAYDQLAWFGLDAPGRERHVHERRPRERHQRSQRQDGPRQGRTEPRLGRHRRRWRPRSARRRPRQRRRRAGQLPLREHDRPEERLARRAPPGRRHHGQPRRHRGARHPHRRRRRSTSAR